MGDLPTDADDQAFRVANFKVSGLAVDIVIRKTVGQAVNAVVVPEFCVIISRGGLIVIRNVIPVVGRVYMTLNGGTSCRIR